MQVFYLTTHRLKQHHHGGTLLNLLYFIYSFTPHCFSKSLTTFITNVSFVKFISFYCIHIDGVTGICYWRYPSGRIMALGSTQPLTEMSTRIISWGWKQPVRRADNFTIFMFDCLEIWELQTSGDLRVCPGLYRVCVTFIPHQHRQIFCYSLPFFFPGTSTIYV